MGGVAGYISCLVEGALYLQDRFSYNPLQFPLGVTDLPYQTVRDDARMLSCSHAPYLATLPSVHFFASSQLPFTDKTHCSRVFDLSLWVGARESAAAGSSDPGQGITK